MGTSAVLPSGLDSFVTMVMVSPSMTEWEACFMLRYCSSSVKVTMVFLFAPALTLLGRSPKRSLIFSPFSLELSSFIVRVNVCPVSPLLKVTWSGTPSYSSLLAPPLWSLVIGMVTVRSGSALRDTVIVTLFSSISGVDGSSYSCTV